MKKFYQRIKGYRRVDSIYVPGVVTIDPLYVYDPIAPKISQFLKAEYKWLAMFLVAIVALVSK